MQVDASGQVMGINAEAERLTGWSERDALGRHAEEVFTIRAEKARDANPRLVMRALEHCEVVCLPEDTVLVSRIRAERNICGSVWPLLDDSAGLCGAGIVFHDWTQATRDLHWLAFMHGASEALSDSLDFETTLSRVVRLAVDSIADACAVALVQPDGTIRGYAGAHADPQWQPLVDELVKTTRLDPGAAEGAPRAIRDCKPVVYLDVREGFVEPGHRYVLGSRDRDTRPR